MSASKAIAFEEKLSKEAFSDYNIAKKYCQKAKGAAHPFELTISQFTNLLSAEVCQYSGHKFKDITDISLERVDPTKPYCESNCLAVNLKSNAIKNSIFDVPLRRDFNGDMRKTLNECLKIYSTIAIHQGYEIAFTDGVLHIKDGPEKDPEKLKRIQAINPLLSGKRPIHVGDIIIVTSERSQHCGKSGVVKKVEKRKNRIYYQVKMPSGATTTVTSIKLK